MKGARKRIILIGKIYKSRHNAVNWVQGSEIQCY